MKTIAGLYYSNDHEWVKVEDTKAYVGITDFAQHALGKIVYVELPELDEEYQAGDIFCVIESVKAASDSYLPVSGKVLEINEELEDSPQLLNDNPYENWITVIEMQDDTELDNLMDEVAYIAFCEEEE
ncbi:MAG: glycine cleavage system protein GcvH [Eubacteriales bacterium]|nr:glycine cleavage system protein GcvH [Eubacteriales bacterium]MDD4583796.1 glycine cleavage system protein GcvH [Eubacteriales bacterium]